jgi:uncharacterized membrane protein
MRAIELVDSFSLSFMTSQVGFFNNYQAKKEISIFNSPHVLLFCYFNDKALLSWVNAVVFHLISWVVENYSFGLRKDQRKHRCSHLTQGMMCITLLHLLYLLLLNMM